MVDFETYRSIIASEAPSEANRLQRRTNEPDGRKCVIVSVGISSLITGALIVGVSGFFIFLWFPLVVAFTFMYQSIGTVAEESLIRVRRRVYEEELKNWSMGQRIQAVTAWPVILVPLIIWYAAKASFNLQWEELTREVEEPSREQTPSKAQV